MADTKYMWFPLAYLPDKVMDAYELHDKVQNGRVLVRIVRGMYGLPQSGRLAYNHLKAHLEPYGYRPCRLTPGLWKHDTCPITFCLVVDDFGIKYEGREHFEHLGNALLD